MSISAETRARAAERDLNEPTGAERSAALASFQASVEEAVGAEAASRFGWALLAALRQSKWDGERALKKVKKLVGFAAANDQYFEGLAPEEFLDQAKIGMTSHLPTRNARGELVLLINGKKIADYAKSYALRDMLRFSVFYMTLLLQDEDTQVHGAIILEDLHDYPLFALNSMKGMGPTGMKASFDWLGAAPLRLRGLYACRQPWYVGMMMALVKPFMSKKLRERTRLFGQDTAAMLTAAGLRPEQVPPEYGGTLGGFDPAWYLKGKIHTVAPELM